MFVNNSRWPHIKFSDRIQIKGDIIEVHDENNDDVLNDLNINPIEIYKCMSFERSKSLIENTEQLCFVSPKLWVDPFESFLYDEKAFKSYNKKLFCFTASFMRSESEEALWKIYANESDKTHNIWRMIFINLLNTLENYGKTTDTIFYLAPINYSKSKEAIKQLKNITCNSIDNHIDRMSYKRKAFKSDHEIRIYACVNADSNKGKDLLFINANLTNNNKKDKIINSVILEPYPPYQNILKDPYGYAVKQHIRNLDMRDYYKKMSIRSEESRLYLVSDINKTTLTNRIKKIASNI